MKLAVIGSREGADLEHVETFVLLLPSGTTVVSGGANGVDSVAEQTHRSVGGSVTSFRVKRFADYNGEEVYGVQRLELSDEGSSAHDLLNVDFADYTSALWYRDMLIAQECDRLVAHMRPGGSRGSLNTCQFAENEQKPVFKFERAA